MGTADAFLEGLHARASHSPRTLLFPEADDARTVDAVRELVAKKSVRPVLIGPGDDVPGVERIDPLSDARRADVVALLLARRASKGMTEEQARAYSGDALMFADALVALGHADGCVAGATHTTGDVIRSALWTVGTAPGVRTVSSSFYMLVAPFRSDSSEVLTFTDCAVVRNPTARQLADIAQSAAQDRRKIVGDEPRIAFLSFSSVGSAEGDSVTRVREAVALVRAEAPQLSVDGELQGDAALIASVAARKAPGSPTAGQANVLVFPSLDAGNIAYKLVQRLAHAVAIGPIVQGLAHPCSDLSRGATANDIVQVAAITALKTMPRAADSSRSSGD